MVWDGEKEKDGKRKGRERETLKRFLNIILV